MSVRMIAIAAAAALLLAACSRPASVEPQEAAGLQDKNVDTPVATIGGEGAQADGLAVRGDVFAYSHFLSLAMPSASVRARFDLARERCLKDPVFGCELLTSSINMGDEHTETPPSAELTVKLPRNEVEAFEQRLIEPLADESPGEVVVRARSTTADNVTQQVADLGRRMAQLTDYRDRLTALTKRSDVRAAELIQIAGELSKVQSDIEQATAQQHDLADRVAKERLTINLGEREGSAVWRPLVRVWRGALDLLIDSLSDALRFVIVALPWLPIMAFGVALLAWIWRRVRRRPTASPDSSSRS